MELFRIIDYSEPDQFLKSLFKQSPLAWDLEKIRELPKLYIRLILFRYHQPCSGNKDRLIERIENFIALARLIKENTIQIENDFILKPSQELSKLKEIKPILKKLNIKFSYLGKKEAILNKALLFYKSCYSKKFIKSIKA